MQRIRDIRATLKQKTYLLEYLESHTEIFEDEMLSHLKLEHWKKLAKKLNGLDLKGAQKSGAKWLKYWYDQRNYILDRYAKFKKQSRKKTGFDITCSARPRKLNDYEIRVLKLTHFDQINNSKHIDDNPHTENKLPTVPVESVETAIKTGIQCRDDSGGESLVKQIKLEWDSDHSSSPLHDNSRKRRRSLRIETKANEEITEEPLIEHIKFEDPPEEVNLPGTTPDQTSSPRNTQSATRSRPFLRFSNPYTLNGTYNFPSRRKTKVNTVDREIQLKMLAVMRGSHQFKRKMETKRLQVEEKKVERIDRLIAVLHNGFDQIANL